MKTNTFHQSVFLCCFFLFAGITSAYSQSSSKKPHIANYSAAGCLACSGSEWNDYNYIKQLDGKFATSNLAAEGYCFQTICYYSRGLMASDFQFSIPATATVTGVRVRVTRMADKDNAVYDYDIQLMKNLTPQGDNKASADAWPVTAANKVYGGVNDQWGISLTPSLVNSSDYGFWLQSQNLTKFDGRTASVDFVKMTVYYLVNGKLNEQTSEAASVNQMYLYPNPLSTSSVISFSLNYESRVQVDLYDEAGKKLRSLLNEEFSSGTHEFNLNRGELNTGVYFVHLMMNGETVTRKLIIE